MNEAKNRSFDKHFKTLITKYCDDSIREELDSIIDSIRKVEGEVVSQSRANEPKVELGLAEEHFVFQVMAHCRLKLAPKNFLHMLVEAGTLCVDAGEYATAEELYTDALQTALKDPHHRNEAAEALQKRADVYLRQTLWDLAKKDLTRSRMLFVQAHNDLGVGKTENSFGIFMAQQGKTREGITRFKKAASLFEKAKEAELASVTNMNLGILATMRGDFDEALVAYERALPEFERTGDVSRLAELHHNLGMLFFARSDVISAIKHFDESLTYSNQLQYEELIGLASLGKAAVYAKQKDFALALLFDNKSLSIFRKLNAHRCIADAYKVKGIIQRGLKHYASAKLFFQTSITMNEGHNSPLNLGESYLELGILYKETGERAQAIDVFQKSLVCFEKVGAVHAIAMAKVALTILKT